MNEADLWAKLHLLEADFAACSAICAALRNASVGSETALSEALWGRVDDALSDVRAIHDYLTERS